MTHSRHTSIYAPGDFIEISNPIGLPSIGVVAKIWEEQEYDDTNYTDEGWEISYWTEYWVEYEVIWNDHNEVWDHIGHVYHSLQDSLSFYKAPRQLLL